MFVFIALLLAPGVSSAGDIYKKMGKDLARPLIGGKEEVRVAVLAFPHHDGRQSAGSSILSERLTIQVASYRGVRVIERALIQKMLEERRWYETGVLDSDSARQFGKLLNADILITGTLVDLGNGQVEVNARGMNAETGAIISASRAIVPKAWGNTSSLQQREPVTTQRSDGDLNSLAKRLIKNLSHNKPLKAAILTFPNHDGRISNGSTIVAERLITALVGRKNFQVVERRLIQKMLQEKNLSETGLMDESEAKKFGKVLNVDVLVTGTLIDMDSGLTEINARMIDTQSGEILSAASESIERVWYDRPTRPRSIPLVRAVTPVSRDEEASTAEPAELEVSPPMTGSARSFSNESFPPGRRIYHPQAVGPVRKIPQSPVNETFPAVNAPAPAKPFMPMAVPQEKSFVEKRIEKQKRGMKPRP